MYTPIDALNHGYHYETLKVEIPHEDFVGMDEESKERFYDDMVADEWYQELDNTIRQSLYTA